MISTPYLFQARLRGGGGGGGRKGVLQIGKCRHFTINIFLLFINFSGFAQVNENVKNNLYNTYN